MCGIFIQFVYYGKVRVRLNQKSISIYNILLLLVIGKLRNESLCSAL